MDDIGVDGKVKFDDLCSNRLRAIQNVHLFTTTIINAQPNLLVGLGVKNRRGIFAQLTGTDLRWPGQLKDILECTRYKRIDFFGWILI